MSIYEYRKWMYAKDSTEEGSTNAAEFRVGLEGFMQQAGSMQITLESGRMHCPCPRCQNNRCIPTKMVWSHLLNRGFMPHYYVWYNHGEGHHSSNAGSSSNYRGVDIDESRYSENFEDQHVESGQNCDRIHDMVNNAFHETAANLIAPEMINEEPNIDAKRFYDMLDAANEPLYDGCKDGLSKLSLAARMMNIKTDHNLGEVCMDDWADLIKEYLPENNLAPERYYDIQKLVFSLGLPSEMIDVCVDNCMLYWREYTHLQECRFCGKPRFKPQGVGSTKVPYQRMWYLPITDRLKRMYQSERTASSMRWHAEHLQTEGVLSHPSDAKAWKHFNTGHPEFAREKRNVYLGLCTDGFSPFGMSGRQYSLWPVILTPYNLPPDMCMQREFLFLSILVPGPKHPKRSLDVFLQPLIEELKHLWYNGVESYDISSRKNFTMRAVLMWTISDYPAYGMLSGWTTHGRLSCPYCMNRTDAFQLKHGRKTSWFDCHRRFLPIYHSYRGNKRLFKRNKVVRTPAPVYLSGEELEAQIDYYGALETVIQGGNWHTPAHMPDGYGEHHNWHKKSIFWDLPYWKDHLLRHNLDVMHIEKNFFENIMHTVLNVKGRTKDSVKSRLDLPDICSRTELHITSNGEAPVPKFRLKSDEKAALFKWASSDVKFPDGYVSNLAKCVEGQKFAGMKSHDCHVFMQRLLPIAFAELLPDIKIHEAIAGA